MNATIFALDTGEILKVVTCPYSDLHLQFDAGTQGYVLDRYGDDKFFIDTAAKLPVAKPPQPSEHHSFNYTTKQWQDPRTPETEWPLVRQQRDALLAKSDWTQLPDVPLATKDAWATYRQALRDITLQPDPFNIDWPTVPI
jgi:hypothetical protein